MNKKLLSTFISLTVLFLIVSTSWAGSIQPIAQFNPLVTDRQSLLVVEEEEPADTAEIITVEGVVGAISDAGWTVAGTQFATDEYTYIDSALAVDDEAFVLAESSEAGTVALVIVPVDSEEGEEEDGEEDEEDELFDDEFPSDLVAISGSVEANSATAITVAGVTFTKTAETDVEGDIQIGGSADVAGHKAESGALVADFIATWDDSELPECDAESSEECDLLDEPFLNFVAATGQIEAVSDSEITVAGVTFALSSTTTIVGQPEVGVTADVVGYQEDGGALVADFVTVFGDDVLPICDDESDECEIPEEDVCMLFPELCEFEDDEFGDEYDDEFEDGSDDEFNDDEFEDDEFGDEDDDEFEDESDDEFSDDEFEDDEFGDEYDDEFEDESDDEFSDDEFEDEEFGDEYEDGSDDEWEDDGEWEDDDSGSNW